MAIKTHTVFNPIAQGCLTNSKHPDRFIKGVYPDKLIRGKGCRVYDLYGNDYIDFIAGLGSNILGYAHEGLIQKEVAILKSGVSLSLGTPTEVEAAERVRDLVPFIDKVKFTKTGTEACAAAIRIARAHTKREKILTSGYHGWSDEFISLLEPAAGIPTAKHWNIIKLKNLARIDDDIAAVIVEPIELDASPSRREFLKSLISLCNEKGVMVIFDEVITGLRVPGHTVAKYWDLKPDLIVLGKAWGNGLPISMVCGKAEVMDNPDYFVSGTFYGDRLSLQRLINVTNLIETAPISKNIDFLWRKGDLFRQVFNGFDPEIQLEGYATRSAFKGNTRKIHLLWQEACKAGILLGPSFFYTYAHLEVSDMVLCALENIVRKINTNKIKLLGPAPTSPFSAKARK